jgi:predicted kinase
MLALVEESVGAGGSLVVEANFVRGSELERRFADLPASVVQVHCSAPLEVLLERYAARDRHPGHVDGERLDALREAVQSGRHEPLDLPGETIRIETTQPVDYEALLDALSR